MEADRFQLACFGRSPRRQSEPVYNPAGWQGGQVRRRNSVGLDYTPDNIPGQQIRFHAVKAPTGGRARGIYTLTPVDGGKRTAVVARLHLEVVGVARLVVSDEKIRRMRHAKLERDLRDTERWFAQRSRKRALAR